MSDHNLATVIGYTAQWFPETNEVQIELDLLNNERKSLGKMDMQEAGTLLSMLGKDGKKSISYRDGAYMQVNEYYRFK